MKEHKMQPTIHPDSSPATEGKHFEVVKRFLEQKNEEAILECFERMDKKKKSIGLGKNAEVFAVEDEPMFEDLCVKKVAKLPKVKINSIETEFEFQEEVNKIGIRTPRNIMVVKNIETREEFIIMERIKGHSIGDITDLRSNIFVKDTYNHEVFFQELKEMVEKMHEHRIYHRDLHSGNVMIGDDGHPVIIDFGAATYGYGDDEEIYLGTGFVLESEKTGKYLYGSSMLPDDNKQVRNLEIQMRPFK